MLLYVQLPICVHILDGVYCTVYDCGEGVAPEKSKKDWRGLTLPGLVDSRMKVQLEVEAAKGVPYRLPILRAAQL